MSMYVASCPLKSESLQLAGLYHQQQHTLFNRHKGKEQTVQLKRLQQRTSHLLSPYIIFLTGAQHPSQGFFQRQVLVAWVLVLMLRRITAGPDLLCVWETTTENPDCGRWRFCPHSRLHPTTMRKEAK